MTKRTLTGSLLLALVLLALILGSAVALAATDDFIPDTYEIAIEYEVAADDCGHEGFVGTLPTSITMILDADGNFVLQGDPPWVELKGSIDQDGSVTAAGTGTVAGFDGTSAQFDGGIDVLGDITGTLSFGVDGELPGGCPIIWTLVFLSGPERTLEPTTTTTSTGTTVPVTQPPETPTSASQMSAPVTATSEPGAGPEPGDGNGIPALVIVGLIFILIGVVGLITSGGLPAGWYSDGCSPGATRNCRLAGSSIVPRADQAWKDDLDRAVLYLKAFDKALNLVGAAAAAGTAAAAEGAARAGAAVTAVAEAAGIGSPTAAATTSLTDAVIEGLAAAAEKSREKSEGVIYGYDILLQIKYETCCKSWLPWRATWKTCTEWVRFPPIDSSQATEHSRRHFSGTLELMAWDRAYVLGKNALKPYAPAILKLAQKTCESVKGCC